MVWFRVDDSFDFHPKSQKAGNKALGLWVRSGSFSSRQLTEGFIAYDMIRKLGGTKGDARALVDAGLWDDCPDERGYRFHQWEQANPSREQVLADRAATAERQRRARARSRGESQRDAPKSNGVSHGVSHGPPDPTRPVSTSIGHLSSSSHLPEREAEGPTTTELIERGIGRLSAADLTIEADAFRAHNEGRWPELHDWRRAWSGWLTKAAERNRATPTPGRPECPDHPGQPTGSVQCPECAKTTGPPPTSLRALRDAAS